MKRKNSLRLKDYDYSLPGPYFFTICTFTRKEIFKEQDIRDKVIEVFKNLAGKLGVTIHAIVVASNHIHGIVTLPDDKRIILWQYIGMAKVRITQTIIGQDATLSLPLRDRIWQRSFYEHVIRDEEDFSEKAQYIVNHPIKEVGKHICGMALAVYNGRRL
jgi:putative transposase